MHVQMAARVHSPYCPVFVRPVVCCNFLTYVRLARRLFGIHMNCCSINDERGSKLPPDCKLAALPALLQWHALYAEGNTTAVAV
jgi:hypothetical protein